MHGSRCKGQQGIYRATNPSDLLWGESGSGTAQIPDEQRPAVMSNDVTIGAHMVFPLSLGMGRENGWEFMCLQTWKKFMEP